MQRNELGQVGREGHGRQREQHVLRPVGGLKASVGLKEGHHDRGGEWGKCDKKQE